MKNTAKLPEGIDRPEGTEVFAIWPGNGVPPGSEDWTWGEQTLRVPWADNGERMVTNVVIPTLTLFRPSEGQGTGASLIIAPGGAFHFLMVDHEGYDMARRLARRGLTSFVLRYRVARTPEDGEALLDFRTRLREHLPPPAQDEINPPSRGLMETARHLGEADGRQAVRFVRENAAELGLDPERIGISGFSAGGGVAMGAVLEHDAATRPDFAACIYPAYRTGAVPEDAPPLFLVTADDDKSVAPISTTRLYEAWHRAGVAAEVHVFQSGAHGFGMRRQGTLSDAWFGLLENWLLGLGAIG